MRAAFILSIVSLAACSESDNDLERFDATDATPDAAAETTPDVAPDMAPDGAPTIDDNFGVIEDEGDAACDNLDPSHCLFPYPSDRFRVTTAAGPRITLDGATPKDRDGVLMGAAEFADRDGWSPLSQPIFSLPGLALPEPRYVDHQPFDIAASLAPASPTVVIDATTGERVAHWAELDHFARDKGEAIVFLRLPQPLAYATRYVVAVRGQVDQDGAALPAPPGFAALRDKTASHVRGMHSRRAHFEADVFPVLAAAGIERADLQLAWDFTTATEANTAGTLGAMRDTLYELIGDDGPTYTIDDVTDYTPEENTHIARRVTLSVNVPSFLGAPDEIGVRALRRGSDGRPQAEGSDAVVVEVQIPRSVITTGGAGVVQYGHGLFYSREEGNQGWLRELADRAGWLIVALDMEGMSEPNIGPFSNAIATDLGRYPRLADWPTQGIMNHLAVQRLLKKRLAAAADPALSHEGALLYDPARVFYYGNSQGGLHGGSIMALTRDVPRGVLGVPGCAFAHLIHKSVGFSNFAVLVALRYPDPFEFAAILGLVQLGFDRVEPLNFASQLADTTAPAITRRVLLQVAKEDATVDNHVSFIYGRAYGATLITPAVRPIWGLETSNGPVTTNALTEFDFGHPDNPDPFAPPPRANDTHEDLRRLRVAQDQIVRFLETGETAHLCDGVCDPD